MKALKWEEENSSGNSPLLIRIHNTAFLHASAECIQFQKNYNFIPSLNQTS